MVLVGLAVAASGCSSGRVAMQKKLTELNHEVVQLRASNLALQDRVDALETTAPAARTSEPSADDQPDGRPSLAVVRLAPDASETDEAPTEVAPSPADDGPRVSIQGDESGVEQVNEDDEGKAKRPPRGSGQRRR